MRVCFDLRAKHGAIPDREGVEVADLEQAFADALELLCELRENENAVRDWSGWALEAADATGRIVFSLDLDAIAAVSPLQTRSRRNARRLYDHRAHLRLLRKARKLLGPTS